LFNHINVLLINPIITNEINKTNNWFK